MQSLFGGALACSLPAGSWFDVSQVRPSVPDNQEVFALEGSDRNQALIVEIVEYAAAKDVESALFYFADLEEQVGLGQGSSDIDFAPAEVRLTSDAAYAACVSGIQQTAPHSTRVTLGLVRLPQYDTDILFTLSSSLDSSASGPLDTGTGAAAAMVSVLQSLRVIDAGLFSAGDGASSPKSNA